MDMPAAVLWDMDGTIVDTEPLWMAAETRLVESFGGTWTQEQGLQLVGSGPEDAGRVLRAAGVALEPQEIQDVLTADVAAALGAGPPPFRPGAAPLLAALRDAGVPTALVTMSLRLLADAVLAHLPQGIFDVIVSSDTSPRPKPHPDPYLRAAELLGADIRRCVALEDSPNGLRSALSSGAVTIAVPHIVPLDGLGAHAVWSSLADRGLGDLAVVFASHGTAVAGREVQR